jgi:hypothetical protein
MKFSKKFLGIFSLCAVLFFPHTSLAATHRGECVFQLPGAQPKLPFEVVFSHDQRADLRPFQTFNAATFRRPTDGSWPLWFTCDTSSTKEPLQSNPGRLNLYYLDETNTSEQYAKKQIALPQSCTLHEVGRGRIIGIAECKTLKDATKPIRYSSFAVAQEAYARECSGADAQPADSDRCKDLLSEVKKFSPDFKTVCFDYGVQTNSAAVTQRALLEKMYQACGLTLRDTALGTPTCGPEGIRKINGHNDCVCNDERMVWDDDTNKCVAVPRNICARLGRVWNGNSCELKCVDSSHGLIKVAASGDEMYKCGACVAPQVKDSQGHCTAPTTQPITPTLPYCSPTFYYNAGDCRCNADEEKSSGQYGDVICKKKIAPSDVVPPEKKYPPGTECQKRGTDQRGVIAADGVTCTQAIESRFCSSACDAQTQQCVSGKCVPKTPETKAPPLAPPCQPEKQPCTPQQGPGTTLTNPPPSQQPPGPQNQRPSSQQGQDGKQDPLSQLAKQMAQKGQGQGSQGQQGAQQQQDPSLMQRLMQMFQPKPFTNPFGSEAVNQITCESFDIDAAETTGGLFRVKIGEPIEVTWSVSGAKRVTVDTTPRTSTKYDGNIGDATSATVTPSRSGTLTLRLKIDGNLHTKEPCKAKKVRVRQ